MDSEDNQLIMSLDTTKLGDCLKPINTPGRSVTSQNCGLSSLALSYFQKAHLTFASLAENVRESLIFAKLVGFSVIL